MRYGLGAALVMLAAQAWAQAPGGTDDLVRLGGVATLAPLCGMRAQDWAFDLRRAELQSATGTKRFDDEALRAAPGRAQVELALGYAEMEAEEDFAGSPLAACGKLAGNPDLARADDVVNAFRAQRAAQPGS